MGSCQSTQVTAEENTGSQGWSTPRSSHEEQPLGNSKHQARVDKHNAPLNLLSVSIAAAWNSALSTTVNFGPPESEGMSRITALQHCKQHWLCTENPHAKVPLYVTAAHRKVFGMRSKPHIRPSSMAILQNKKKKISKT